jgi:hypothetical protein
MQTANHQWGGANEQSGCQQGACVWNPCENHAAKTGKEHYPPEL